MARLFIAFMNRWLRTARMSGRSECRCPTPPCEQLPSHWASRGATIASLTYGKRLAWYCATRADVFLQPTCMHPSSAATRLRIRCPGHTCQSRPPTSQRTARNAPRVRVWKRRSRSWSEAPAFPSTATQQQAWQARSITLAGLCLSFRGDYRRCCVPTSMAAPLAASMTSSSCSTSASSSGPDPSTC